MFADGLITTDSSGKLVSAMPLTTAEQAECGGDEKKITELKEAKLKETLRAFRNALDDGTTENDTGYYLTGYQANTTKGQPVKYIYWGPAVDGFNIVFRKIDGNGDALPGATFTLYEAKEDGSDYADKDASGNPVVYQVSGEDATAVSGGDSVNHPAGRDLNNAVTIWVNRGTVDDPDETERDVYDVELGLAVFEKIPPGKYFIMETTPLAVTSEGVTTAYNAVEDMYLLEVFDKGYYTISKVEVGEDSEKKPTYTDTGAAPTETMSFVEGASAYTVDVPLVLNVDARTRKAILRKVDGNTYAPLENAVFTIYYADKQTVVKVKSTDSS